MIKEPEKFYAQQLRLHKATYQNAKRKLLISSLSRLFVFVIVGIALYLLYPSAQHMVAVAILGFILFAFLLKRHNGLQYKANKAKILAEINTVESEVLKGNYSQLATGEEFGQPDHPFSQDIDLFGHASFFQYLNRTATAEGKAKLASYLLSNSLENIEMRQQAVQELVGMPEWRQEYLATAQLSRTQIKVRTLLNWIHSYQSFVPNVFRYLPFIFGSISGLLILAYIFFSIPALYILIWFFVGLGITGRYVKSINKLYVHIGEAEGIFNQYEKLIRQVEEQEFSSDYLQKQRDKITNTSEKASAVLRKLYSYISALDQRNNMIFAALGNGFLLWDLDKVYKIECWIQNYKQHIEDWFAVVSSFDSYASLANFSFNHPEYVYPVIHSNAGRIINAEQLGHPLLNPEKRVANDLQVDQGEFFIITGANMAGKSTFLRTTALAIVMANVGLPVCATRCIYRPIRLYTSMRTTDSLSDEASYFYAELVQLKRIVEAIEEKEYFIILDEILKGTNSKDKAEGSRKFVEKLVKAKATGIIATHDLSLCEIATEIPQVKNRYFDAQIQDDELYFDYRYKEGICQNMNASFLLKKMGIV